jgi:hypothetical protein
MTAARALRPALAALCLFSLSVGAAAAFAPRVFYEDFPFYARWVSILPPYNEHLVTDVGGLYLGFAVVLAWAVWRPEPTLVRAATSGFVLVAALHFAFHAGHLDAYGTADAIAQMVSLGLVLALAAFAFWAADRR